MPLTRTNTLALALVLAVGASSFLAVVHDRDVVGQAPTVPSLEAPAPQPTGASAELEPCTFAPVAGPGERCASTGAPLDLAPCGGDSPPTAEIRAELARMQSVFVRYQSRVDAGPWEEVRAVRSLAVNSLCVVLRAQGRAQTPPEGGIRRTKDFHPIVSNCGYFELPVGEYPVLDEILAIAKEASTLEERRKEIPDLIHAEHRAFAERTYAEAVAWIHDGR